MSIWLESSRKVSMHNLTKIGVCEAGTIFSRKLEPVLNTTSISFNPPDKIMKYLGLHSPDAEKYRRGLELKMKENSPNKFPVVGKPASAFILINKGGETFIHYLSESPFYNRHKVIHTYMVEFDEANGKFYHPGNLLTRQSLWSGHLANLTRPYSNEGFNYLFLFDKFDGAQPQMKELDQKVVVTTVFNKILPVTSDAHIILK